MKIVPALRFPEFGEDGEWKSTELGKYLLKHPEYGIGASAVPYSEKLPTYLRITDISVDGKFLKEDKVSVAEKVTKANYLKEGDIVFARTGASVGKSYKYRVEDGELVFAGFLIRVKPNPSSLNSELLFQFTSTEQYWKWVKLVSARSGQPGINGKQYASMPILLPTNPKEQQKIAACLSSLDEVITAETEKLDLYQDHKKGLLQQLFPTEGETQPKYRFPEFKEDGEWEEKEFNNLIINISPPKKLKSNQFNESGKYPIVDQSQSSIAGWTDDDEALIKNDFPLVVFGDHTCILKIIEKPFVQGADGIKIFKGNKLIDTRYLFYALQSNPLIMTEYKRHYSILKEKTIVYPEINSGEQQKIAACLSAADALIETQAQKIEALQAHKKGLLQGLFPTIID